MSNLAKWTKLLGISARPDWLTSQSADTWATAIGIVILGIGLAAIVTLIRQRLHRATAKPSAALPPVSVSSEGGKLSSPAAPKAPAATSLSATTALKTIRDSEWAKWRRDRTNPQGAFVRMAMPDPNEERAFALWCQDVLERFEHDYGSSGTRRFGTTKEYDEMYLLKWLAGKHATERMQKFGAP